MMEDRIFNIRPSGRTMEDCICIFAHRGEWRRMSMPGEKRINPQNPARTIRGRKQKKQTPGDGVAKRAPKHTSDAAPIADAGTSEGS
jgi:hypothetical protein